MEIIIKGEAKEIAALLLEIKARPAEINIIDLSKQVSGEIAHELEKKVNA